MHPESTNPGAAPAEPAWSSGVGAVPLFHAAWLFGAGILAVQRLCVPPGFLLAALAALTILCALAGSRAQRVAWLPLALLWCILGAWCAEMEPHPAPAAVLADHSDGLLRTVEGTVVDAGPVRGESFDGDDQFPKQARTQRIDLRVSSIEVVSDIEDAQAAVTGAVRLTLRWPQAAVGTPVEPLLCGDRIRAAAQLLPPETYHTPGVWSRADYLVDQGITSTGSLSFDRVERVAVASDRSFGCRLRGWQHASSARLLSLPERMRNWPAPMRLDRDDAIMLAAMITGDRTFLDHSLRVGFERTGSFHMLVVSGFHLAILAGCVFWIAGKLRVPRVPATFLTIFAALAFALFTGFATPVQRSLWMVTLYLLGRLVYRQRSPLNTIGFAALCMMVESPRSLLDASLQMTLLAVASIGAIATPLLERTIHPYLAAARDLRLIALDVKLAPHLAQFRVVLRMFAARLERIMNRWIAWQALPWLVRFVLRTGEMLVVATVVEIAMTLPMAVYFHRITVFALPVNLLILPLLGVLMPSALLTLLVLLVWPAAAVVPAALTGLLLHLGVGLVHLFGSLAFGDFRLPAPSLAQAAAFCVFVAAAMVMAHGTRWARRASWMALALAAIAAVAPRPIDHPHHALLVEAIDVGQGDSILLISPDGKTLLVDGGGFGGGPRTIASQFDIGEDVVSPALWARGIRHLDAVALSHAHSDHMGGVPAVLRNFHPDELWVGNNPRSPAYNDLINQAAALHISVRSMRAGDALNFGGSRVNVLAPFRDYQPGSEPANNDSLVLHVTLGQTSVLLEGDAESPVERRMMSEPGLGATLLKVGHHGSVNATDPEFLAQVSPRMAVISCGPHNRYGHPNQQVLEELQAARVNTWRTDISGSSCFTLDGRFGKAVSCPGMHAQ